MTERLVYEEEQLMAIVSLDEESQRELDSPGLSKEAIHEAVKGVAGKVWSAKFRARKPAQSGGCCGG